MSRSDALAATVLVPFAAGSCAVTGSLRLIRCRPPLAGDEGGEAG